MRRSCPFGEKVPDLLLAHAGHRGLLHCALTTTKLGPHDQVKVIAACARSVGVAALGGVLTVVCQVVTFPRRGFSKGERPLPRHERGNAWCLHRRPDREEKLCEIA